MIVNKQKEIGFINDCTVIVDYKILAEAIYWYSSKPTTRLKHIYLHGKYPAYRFIKKKYIFIILLGCILTNEN
jgi:hypothetical protein